MDELELIKKDWQKRSEDLPVYSKKELCAMIHKKSSSIVKWIFIISILEFAFWIVIELLSSNQNQSTMIENLGMTSFLNIATYINYTVLAVFILLFFINYKRIQIHDSAKQLMKQIIKTRQTVKYYVGYNIVFLAIIFIITSVRIAQINTDLGQKELWIHAGIMSLILIIMISFFLLFYRVLYGILTRRLYKNYKTLSKIEV